MINTALTQHLYPPINDPLLTVNNTLLFNYWRPILAKKLMSQFEFTFPDHWPHYWPEWLVMDGATGIQDLTKPDIGPAPVMIAVSKTGYWYQPTHVNVQLNGGYIKGDQQIGKDVEIAYISPDWAGARTIIYHYAMQLALADDTTNTSLIQARTGFIISVDDVTARESVYAAYKKLADGQPIVTINKDHAKKIEKSPMAFFENTHGAVNASKNLENRDAILQNFNREIGIRNANTKKKERLVTSEVEATDEETECLIDYWLRHIKDSFEVCNAHYGTGLEVKRHVSQRATDDIGRDTVDEAGGA